MMKRNMFAWRNSTSDYFLQINSYETIQEYAFDKVHSKITMAGTTVSYYTVTALVLLCSTWYSHSVGVPAWWVLQGNSEATSSIVTSV